MTKKPWNIGIRCKKDACSIGNLLKRNWNGVNGLEYNCWEKEMIMSHMLDRAPKEWNQPKILKLVTSNKLKALQVQNMDMPYQFCVHCMCQGFDLSILELARTTIYDMTLLSHYWWCSTEHYKDHFHGHYIECCYLIINVIVNYLSMETFFWKMTHFLKKELDFQCALKMTLKLCQKNVSFISLAHIKNH